jgi:hypothetical protein
MPNTPEMTITDPAQMFHLALTDAGIPIDGVALLSITASRPGVDDPIEPHVIIRSDGLIVQIIYRPEATPEQIVEGNDIVMNLDVSPKRVRPLWDIYTDVAALSNNQKGKISDDLKASNNAKIKSLGPPYDGIMMALDWAVTAGTAIQTRDAYCRLASLYTQQNIYYLETPAFDPSINILGWEVIPSASVAVSKPRRQDRKAGPRT